MAKLGLLRVDTLPDRWFRAPSGLRFARRFRACYFDTLPIDKFFTLLDWLFWRPSGSASSGSFLMNVFEIPPDWRFRDPPALAKLGPLRVDTLPDRWFRAPSGLRFARRFRACYFDTLPIDKFFTLLDWRFWRPSGSASSGSFLINVFEIPPDWRFRDPSGLANLELRQIHHMRPNLFLTPSVLYPENEK